MQRNKIYKITTINHTKIAIVKLHKRKSISKQDSFSQK